MYNRMCGGSVVSVVGVVGSCAGNGGGFCGTSAGRYGGGGGNIDFSSIMTIVRVGVKRLVIRRLF